MPWRGASASGSHASVTVLAVRPITTSAAGAAGAVVSISTVAVWVASTLPSRSVERYAIVCSPSFEWSAGAGIATVVPLVQDEAPSTLNSVVATPAPASAALRATVTGALFGHGGASSVVTGGPVSIRTVAVLSASTLPAPSRER